MTKLHIADQYQTLQGEGPNAGEPAVFLRLSGCNLQCGLTESSVMDHERGDDPEEGAEWICDTMDVWRETELHIEPSELADKWWENGFFSTMTGGGTLVVTGGEPLLSQDALYDLFTEIREYDSHVPLPPIEIETNGTIMPDEDLLQFVSQWNVSVKLSNSGMDEDLRINEDTIGRFIEIDETDVLGDVRFKFVVTDRSDVSEIVSLLSIHKIPGSMISLMPAGQTQENLRETYPMVAEICKKYGWSFSPRLQIDIWDDEAGV